MRRLRNPGARGLVSRRRTVTRRRTTTIKGRRVMVLQRDPTVVWVKP